MADYTEATPLLPDGQAPTSFITETATWATRQGPLEVSGQACGKGTIHHSSLIQEEEMGSMDAKTSPVSNGSNKSTLRQLMYGVVANLVALSPGMSMGFSAIALPQMIESDNIDEQQASWIASLAAISTPFGCILSGQVLDRLGRRAAMLAVNGPCLLGWLLLATAPQSEAITQIYIGRLLTGFGAGMACIPATVYLGEVTEQSLRGMLVTWTSIFFSFGILLVYILGYCIKNWRLVSGISAVLPVIAGACVIMFLPESPVWLVYKGRVRDAEVSLRRLRAIKKSHEMPQFVQDEIQGLVLRGAQENMHNKNRKGLLHIIRRFRRPECFKPLMIMNIFFFFQQFSGIFVIIFYAVDVVKEAGVEIDNYLAAVLIGLTRVGITIFISYASKLYGRRPMSVISGSGMTLSMGSLATYLFVVNSKLLSNETINKLNWYPIFALMLYISMSTVGFLTLPFAMVGEVFPAEVRGAASGITTCCGYIFSFVVVKLYSDMLESLGRHGLFLFYSVVSMVGTCFVFMYLPETRGKSLRDIEEYFSSSNGQKSRSDESQECKNLHSELGELDASVNEEKSTKLLMDDLDKHEH